MQNAVEALGRVDVLVGNHARSAPDGDLGDLTAEVLDGHGAVDARSTILLTQASAHTHRDDQPGRIVFLTSGQRLGPMPGEVAYPAAKAALLGVTPTLADQLAHRHITLNTVNPGPVDTGDATGADHVADASMFPTGRWGQPDDAARLITWLCTDDAAPDRRKIGRGTHARVDPTIALSASSPSSMRPRSAACWAPAASSCCSRSPRCCTPGTRPAGYTLLAQVLPAERRLEGNASPR